ncbi:B12-binding domain-containing radical SAM protein [bacterium]|nr:B12-binding domain-containing radical SAM protein [candidate division CSSED10-310 bacterium]
MRCLLVLPLNHMRYQILMPDLGLGYLSTALKRHGHSVRILDLSLEVYRGRLTWESAIRELSRATEDVIGFKAFNLDLPFVQEATAAIRRTHPGTIIIVGGPVTLLYNQLFELLPAIDYAFVGEAEISLPALLERLDASDSLREVPGLVWRDEDGVHCNAQSLVDDLDSLGPIDWDGLKPAEYPLDYFGEPILPVMVTRGCPYHCNYCQAGLISGKKIRSRSIEAVIDDLRYLKSRYGFSTFNLYDDNLTVMRRVGFQFAIGLARSGLNMRWRISGGLRIDTLDIDLMRSLEQAGCYYIYMAIESGSQRVLDLMNRKTDLMTMVHNVHQVAHATTIGMLGFFILGYPGETVTEACRTIHLALSLPLTRAAFFAFTPLPQTPVFDSLSKEGKLVDYHLDRNFVLGPPTGFSYPAPKMRRLRRYAYASFYLRPNILKANLSEIHSCNQLRRFLSRAAAVIGER